MSEQVMKYGARKGTMSTMRRWIAKASARDIRIFPVPGSDILCMHQNKCESDFTVAPNPREANVLLVIGVLTDPLAQKAAVTYQQVPRPRVLLIVGPKPPHLPEPDVHLSLKDDFLEEALPKVRALLQNHAWSEEAEPWEPEFLTSLVEDSDNSEGHGHHHHHGNGDEEEEGHEPEGPDHNHQDNHESHESDDHSDNGNHENSDHANHENHDHGNGSHDHGDMDFMSMVAMTKNLPRPKDGLPMNRSEVHFGPFHPGLPGGLSVLVELDGDTVINASVETGVTARSFEEILPLEANNLPDFMARLNPLTPQTYRLLGKKALADTMNSEPTSSSGDIVPLEKERIASHLNWLATFAKTLGSEWMHREAARWHHNHRKEQTDFSGLLSFTEQIRNMPYLQQRLSVGGVIPKQLLHHVSGPVAKAAGIKQDVRSENEPYQDFGWEPSTQQENNAWGRLLIRLEEIEQSLELIKKVDRREEEPYEIDFSVSGEGTAILESARGTVFLKISISEGKVQKLHMETPSKPLAALVPSLTEEAELSDALVEIASLDISPWEVGFKRAEVI